LLTVADSVMLVPVTGRSSLTDGNVTSKSGRLGSGTVTGTDVEQLFVVSGSSITASTHAP
jgi:hypothetical protein